MASSLLRWFDTSHLRDEELAERSQKFETLAHWMHYEIPDSAEKTVALRKLLEAKDAFVRACVEHKET